MLNIYQTYNLDRITVYIQLSFRRTIMYSYIYLNGEDNFDGNNNGGDDDSFFVVLFYSDPKKVIDPVTK